MDEGVWMVLHPKLYRILFWYAVVRGTWLVVVVVVLFRTGRILAAQLLLGVWPLPCT